MVDAPPTNHVGNRDAEPQIVSSQRILLFSIVTCFTVVFHQESSNSTTAPTGGAQIRKSELTYAILEILDNVKSYGGHLASLIATLLSDIMNSDPHRPVGSTSRFSGVGAALDPVLDSGVAYLL